MYMWKQNWVKTEMNSEMIELKQQRAAESI